jgi:hypothetical protein
MPGNEIQVLWNSLMIDDLRVASGGNYLVQYVTFLKQDFDRVQFGDSAGW